MKSRCSKSAGKSPATSNDKPAQAGLHARSLFREAEQPLSDEQLSESLEIPIRTVRKVLFEMVAAGLLSEVYMKNEITLRAYQPAMPLEDLTPMKVIRSLEDLGGIQLENGRDKHYYELICHLRGVLENLPENKPFGNGEETAGETAAVTSAP